MAALPGMRRGIKKFSVTAAQRVTMKNPSLRRMNLMFRASCPSLHLPALAALRLQVEEHDAPVRILVRSRTREGIVLQHPPVEVFGVVLVPVDALGDRDHRDLVDHHRLELLDD